MVTKIEWTDETWNPVAGCTPVSEGCDHCYARRMANRLRGRHGYPADEPFRVTPHPDRLTIPLHWRRSRRIFVCSMGDLFHEDVPQAFISGVWRTMGETPQHTYQILTKRPTRMEVCLRSGKILPNVWLGVTVESRKHVSRIDDLCKCPAAVRFVSLEPLLGLADISPYLARKCRRCHGRGERRIGGMIKRTACCGYCTGTGWERSGLDWVIVGAETGPGARPMHPDWVRSIRDQCVQAGVPFFFKSWGDWAHEIILGSKIIKHRGKLTSAGVKGLSTEISVGTRLHQWPDATWSARVGKAKAGNVLDGRRWEQYPNQGATE